MEDEITGVAGGLERSADEYRCWIGEAIKRRDPRAVAHFPLSARLDQVVEEICALLGERAESVRAADREGAPAPSGGRVEGRTSESPSHPYPRFYKDGDCLLKVGWGEKTRATYRQRVPWASVDAVIDLLERHLKMPIPVRAMKPLHVGEQDQPGYHVDVAMEWFRTRKWAVSHGHRGYTVVPEIRAECQRAKEELRDAADSYEDSETA